VPPAKHRALVALTVELFHHHKKALWTKRAVLEVSLGKLTDAQQRQAECGATLAELTPLLHTKSQKSAALLVRAAAAESRVDAMRLEVAEEEAHIASVAAQIVEVTRSGEEEMEEAVATYDAAMAEVAALVPKDDLAELRAYNRPPGLVQVVMEAVCILMGVEPKWDAALSLLQDKGFLAKVAGFRHDRVADATLRRLQSYVRNKGFVPAAVEQVSEWTRWTHTGGGKAPAFKPTPNTTRWCPHSLYNTYRSFVLC
jgi:dynein heavy chain